MDQTTSRFARFRGKSIKKPTDTVAGPTPPLLTPQTSTAAFLLITGIMDNKSRLRLSSRVFALDDKTKVGSADTGRKLCVQPAPAEEITGFIDKLYIGIKFCLAPQGSWTIVFRREFGFCAVPGEGSNGRSD